MVQRDPLHNIPSLAVTLFCVGFLVAEIGAAYASDVEEPFLDFSVDNYKVNFISGNLTASVTYEWPRIIFSHSTDPFSPTFELSLPKLFLFNDTNSNGLFEKEEALYVGFLDELHLTWNRPQVEFLNVSDGSQVSWIKMNSTVSLFKSVESALPEVPDWANMTLHYTIFENGTAISNSLGTYSIEARIEMAFNFTLDILKHMESSGIVLEQGLQGGGSTYLFTLAQSDCDGSLMYTTVTSRIDEESMFGTNYTHRFRATDSPRQEIYFVKENGTRQAYYKWDSEPLQLVDGNLSAAVANTSYYTTGTGLALHTVYFTSNGSQQIHQEASIGIIESGFRGRIRDWMMDNMGYVLIVSGASVLAASVVIFFRIIRKKPGEPGEKKDEVKTDGKSQS
jgi:hypothetical protein